MTPEEIAEKAAFADYRYYDGWFIYLDGGGEIGPYPGRDDAERDMLLIVSGVAAAIRDAYERAADICDTCKCRDPQECSHELLAERIRALKGEGQ